MKENYNDLASGVIAATNSSVFVSSSQRWRLSLVAASLLLFSIVHAVPVGAKRCAPNGPGFEKATGTENASGAKKANDTERKTATEKGASTEKTRVSRLQGRVSIQELASPAGDWDATVLPKLRTGTTLTGDLTTPPEGLWYRVPGWAAGTWDVSDREPGPFSTKHANVKIGALKDSKGDVWQFSKGFITGRPWDDGPAERNCQVINALGTTVPGASDRNSFAVTNRDISITHRKVNNSIIRMLVSESKEKYIRGASSDNEMVLVINTTHVINKGFEGVGGGFELVRNYRRIHQFQPDTSPEMLASFREYLVSHNMADLVPPN